ncbi:MAG TPA: type IV pilus assembly protein PilM [Patescibacteria group bacterium]|nr:type IV pilus assembly protein PilM [Patescibacteria group bacterium]
MNTSAFFYHDKPVFGLDIGFRSVKVMQIGWENNKPVTLAYGVGDFDPKTIKDGVIIDPETLAASIQNVFKNQVQGEITTRRVIMGIPATRTFSRLIKLPKLSNKELADAIRTATEQYIPVPIDNLYSDFDITSSNDKEMELFTVSVPKTVIDSYIKLSQLLGLEVVAMETTTSAVSRLFTHTDDSDTPTVLIDFGSISSDITVFDGSPIVTGTVAGGGDNFTANIAQKLHVSYSEALVIKTKYGIDQSKKQHEIHEALQPILSQLLKEIRRMIRYYEERSGTKKKITQIVSLGGGANMPGLNEYLTDALRLPVRTSDPFQHIRMSHLKTTDNVERSLYVTASGLALIKPREVFE